ncbi:hypothetical protein HZH68_009016 [Vespula germanica]|uniref:Uncharacterized protein n=1 Tax=Vespula germanica TaxID=30212 RepID=A0A834JZW6_VESGE|nr:hypothetical protein HZH68_009016 [Vespula germanica]
MVAKEKKGEGQGGEEGEREGEGDGEGVGGGGGEEKISWSAKRQRNHGSFELHFYSSAWYIEATPPSRFQMTTTTTTMTMTTTSSSTLTTTATTTMMVTVTVTVTVTVRTEDDSLHWNTRNFPSIPITILSIVELSPFRVLCQNKSNTFL